MPAPLRQDALSLLRDPRLLQCILVDFDRCGVVGEETNRLAAYLGCIFRELESPLAMMAQLTSAAVSRLWSKRPSKSPMG